MKTNGSLSRRQIATLRYIGRREITVDDLRAANQITLWSLLHRQLVRRGPAGRIYATAEGLEFITDYSQAEMSTRARVADVSERVAALLRYTRARAAG